MTESGVSEPLGARLKVFHVLLVGGVHRLARDVGRQDDNRARSFQRLCLLDRFLRQSTGGCWLLLLLLLLGAFDIALQEGRRLLVNVQREAIVRPFAVVAVHARSHSVSHDVLANPLQLVLRAVFQIQKGFKAHFLALSTVCFCIYSLLLL